ncbi:hypothetical protein [Cohnella sp.]
MNYATLLIRTEMIEPFYVMKYPVTRRLYHFVMNEEEVESNVSWQN